MSKIEIKNVYKIFGSNPDKVLPIVKEGASKEEVLEKTGHTVGLDNVSLSIEEGETFVCMGLSGSGKSTLIRHLNRLIDPTDGDIIVDGNELSEKTKDIEKIRAEVGMVFQQFNLFPHLSILDNCTLEPIWVKKMPKKEDQELALDQHKKVKIAAGWLIDKAGWKGKTFKNYGVHKNQALVLVNYGNAKGSDLLDLSENIIVDIIKYLFFRV